MYVYIQQEPRVWTAGFYKPDGTWESESDHDSRETAAARVHWLNGGSGDDGGPLTAKKPEPKCLTCGAVVGHGDLCIKNGSRCRQALRIVQEEVFNEEDRRNLNAAVDTLNHILKQRGCEHWGGDGTLTSLMDIAIYG